MLHLPSSYWNTKHCRLYLHSPTSNTVFGLRTNHYYWVKWVQHSYVLTMTCLRIRVLSIYWSIGEENVWLHINLYRQSNPRHQSIFLHEDSVWFTKFYHHDSMRGWWVLLKRHALQLNFNYLYRYCLFRRYTRFVVSWSDNRGQKLNVATIGVSLINLVILLISPVSNGLYTQ